ncbi:MAG TPA: hypothetical protein VGA48_04190 [Thermoplasmata archaeon]
MKTCRPFLHSGKQLQSCTSFIVLGELVNEVLTEPKKLDLQDVARILEPQTKSGNLVTYGLGDKATRVFAMAKELRSRERELTPCDAMIVACAIEDPVCSVLYTFDRLLLESHVIQRYVADHRRKIKPVESAEH